MKAYVVTRSDIERCPVRALHVDHYRADGSCKCRVMWRWECSCGKHGRFYRDGNLAVLFGERHANRSRYGHAVRLTDNRGRKHGAI